MRTLVRVVAVFTAVAAGPSLAAAEELRGAAILDHSCGKTAVRHMGLVHAGDMEEAAKLGSPELVARWNALPAEDRAMMTEMMKALAKPEAEFAAEIREHGILTVDGATAKLVVEKTTTDENGTSTETHTQDFAIDSAGCLIAP